MLTYCFNRLENSPYRGILTLLDYETTLETCVSELLKNNIIQKKDNILVDTLLKTGSSPFRFLKYSKTKGAVYLDRNIGDLQFVCDKIIKQFPGIIVNSILTEKERKYYLV